MLSVIHHSVICLRRFSSKPVGAFITAPFLNSLMFDSDGGGTKKVTILDVRNTYQYTKGHLPNAVNCHPIFTYLSTSDTKGIAELKTIFQNAFQEAGICGDEHVITYENSLQTLYGASCRGFYLLKLLGHPNVSILGGGYDKWTQEDYPVTKDVPKIDRGTFQAQWMPTGLWSNQDDVVRAIRDRDAVLLDVRDLDEWNGTSSSPYGKDFVPRKGRLPGAVHMLWKDFMKQKEDGLMYLKSPDDVLSMCAAKGITPDQNIIVYCFKGARAANSFVALKQAGFKNVTNYFASWNEWAKNPDLEIDSTIYNDN